ncbi:single-stranded DNA-binding protein [Nocardia sp. NPDC058379]|uniref:single-stranded DNA-binding protein n=1 Tax=unclassified Nocardia TaxID=2637762 RepID=UPI003668B505
MPGEPTLPLVGNLASDIELTFTPAGIAVAHFTVASTPRVFDRSTGQWRDGDPLFLRCNIWREAAEHAAESLSRGARILVMGRLKQRSYETREGDKRTVYEVEVDELGPSLRFATAKVTRTGRSGSGFAQSATATRTPRANSTPTPANQSSDSWAGDADAATDERAPWERPVLAGAGAGFGEPPF